MLCLTVYKNVSYSCCGNGFFLGMVRIHSHVLFFLLLDIQLFVSVAIHAVGSPCNLSLEHYIFKWISINGPYFILKMLIIFLEYISAN